MSLFDFAKANILRDFRNYFYYFLNCSFSVLIFFLFSVLSFHPALAIVGQNSTIKLVLYLAQGVSFLFSLAFLSYSVGVFLKGRSRQFGLLRIIGASKKQLNRLIFFENMIIGMMALITGILSGFILTKLFLMIAEKVIEDLELTFYFPWKGLLATVIVIGGLFLFISLSAPRFIRKQQVIRLFKRKKEAEKSCWKIFLPIFILFGALSTAIVKLFPDGNGSFIFLATGLITVIAGLYLLYQGMIKLYPVLLKSRGKEYWGNNLIKTRNLDYKINSNAQLMAATTILYSIVLFSLIFIIGAPRNVTEETEKIMPYAYMFESWDEKTDEEGIRQGIKKAVENKSGYKDLEIEFIRLEKGDRNIILSNEMLQKLNEFGIQEDVDITGNEIYLISTDGESAGTLSEKTKAFLENNGTSPQVVGETKESITLSGYFSSVTAVSDEIYSQIEGNGTPSIIYAYDVEDWVKDRETTKELEEKYGSLSTKGGGTFISAYSYYETERLTRNIIAYVGSILCFSFLLAIASLLYSRLYTSLKEEILRYRSLVKMGISKKALRNVTNSTLIWIVLIPFLFSVGFTWIGLLIINPYLSSSYIEIGLFCSIIYLMGEGILYLILKKKYQEDMVEEIYSK